MDFADGGSAACVADVSTCGEAPSVLDDGARRRYRWITPDKPFSVPAGSWHGVRLAIGDTHHDRTPTKDQVK